MNVQVRPAADLHVLQKHLGFPASESSINEEDVLSVGAYIPFTPSCFVSVQQQSKSLHSSFRGFPFMKSIQFKHYPR